MLLKIKNDITSHIKKLKNPEIKILDQNSTIKVSDILLIYIKTI